MKYRTFRNLFIFILIAVASGLVWCGFRHTEEKTKPSAVARTTRYQVADRAPSPEPSRNASARTLTTLEIKGMLDQWLAAHGNRHGKMRINNILPSAPFLANIIRFEEKDAVRFSDDPQQWSMIRLDLNRDGIMDEKWLLINGRIAKREVFGSDGKTVIETQYFNN
jgi:hypothetical protein